MVVRWAIVGMFAVLALLSGCVPKKALPSDVALPSEGEAHRNVRMVEIQREELVRALDDEVARQVVRLVPVYRRTGGRYPEHRIFHIVKGSIYEVLGLQERDILLAANDYLIYDPERFREFVRYLPHQKKASITVRRYGKPITFSYVIAHE